MPRHEDPIPPETIKKVRSVGQASRLHEEKDVTVIGILSGLQSLRKMIKGISVTCRKCGETWERTYDKPELFESSNPVNVIKKCPNCKTGQFFDFVRRDKINAVLAELIDTETFSHVDALQILVFGDDKPGLDNTTDIENHLGEVVQVSGDIYPMKMGNKRNSNTVASLYVKYLVKYLAKSEIELSSQDVKEIRSFPSLVGVDNVVDELTKKFATSIIGYDFVKKGLLLCAASTSMDKTISKLHALLVGDPGLAKSELVKHSAALVPGSRYVSAQYTTGRSLTAIVSNEDGVFILRMGAIPQAKGAIAALNEIGQMTQEDQGLLLDVMEEQHFNTTKYGKGYHIDSPTAIIASCNPKDGSWGGKSHGLNDTDDVKPDMDKIPLLKPLIDRIDFIFVFRDDRSKQALKQYAEEKSAIIKTPPPDYSGYIQKHIHYAKQYFPKPDLSEQARLMLNQYYVGVRAKYGSPRIYEAIRRIAQTIASLKLKKVIDEKDADETINFYNIIMQQWDMLVTLPERASDLAYQECLKILIKLAAPVVYSDLMRMACQANPEVKEFIGETFVLRENKRYRSVLDRLLGHTRVARVGDNPIILEWIHNPSGDSDHVQSDQSDRGDWGSDPP